MSFNGDPYTHGGNPLHGQQGQRPCRNCVDPKAWFKALGGNKSSNSDSQKNGESTSNSDDNQVGSHRKDCPPFVDELGRSSWTLLHSLAARFPDKPDDQQQKDAKELMRLMSLYYPCDHCAADLRSDLQTMPPDVSTQEKFARWMCRLHNVVNKKLGKKEFDCNLVQQRWRDGWSDGSCD